MNINKGNAEVCVLPRVGQQMQGGGMRKVHCVFLFKIYLLIPKKNEIYEVGKMKDKNEWSRSDDLPACEGSLG